MSGKFEDDETQQPPPRQSDGSVRQAAIALSYDETKDDAPRVVAAGHGAIAEAILQIAFENGVKVRQDADLVQILNLVEVGDEIPVEALVAVAEILSYVYRANGRRLGQGQP